MPSQAGKGPFQIYIGHPHAAREPFQVSTGPFLLDKVYFKPNTVLSDMGDLFIQADRGPSQVGRLGPHRSLKSISGLLSDPTGFQGSLSGRRRVLLGQNTALSS